MIKAKYNYQKPTIKDIINIRDGYFDGEKWVMGYPENHIEYRKITEQIECKKNKKNI